MFKFILFFLICSFSIHTEPYLIRGYLFDLEEAKTQKQQAIGLMYRKKLSEKSGMIFIQKEPRIVHFWMKNTFLPLDIIFIDKNLKIVHIHPNAKPFDETLISSIYPISYVIEINAGLTEKYNFKIGDVIQKVQSQAE